jgi:hypothetical protein
VDPDRAKRVSGDGVVELTISEQSHSDIDMLDLNEKI